MIISLTPDGRRFVTDYHLATLSTVGPRDGLHVVAVGFTVADDLLRIITMDGSQKVRNVERDARATVAQLNGPQWLSIAGHARIRREPDAVAHAVALYTARYRPPQPNPRRVVIEIVPDKVMGSAGLITAS